MSEKVRLIYRAEHSKENPYFQMLRATAQNRELTFEARGVLAYVLSKPDDWRVQPSDLEQQCKKSVVYRVLGELIKHGYIERKQERNEKKQIIAWHYLVHENPLPKKQEVALPEVGKLEVEKTDTTEYRKEQNKEKNKKENNTSVFISMKNAIAAIFKWSSPTREEWGVIQKTAKSLIEAGIKVEDIPALHAYCANQFDRFSPAALSKNVSNWRNTMPQPPVAADPLPTEPAPTLTPEQVEQRIMEYNRIMAELNETLVKKVVA